FLISWFRLLVYLNTDLIEASLTKTSLTPPIQVEEQDTGFRQYPGSPVSSKRIINVFPRSI
ncbi:hypothetical protein ODV97_19420, partial [Enterococcus gallinarum]|nr:hypothetical protein [Enterococcus gallinarum]